jgi:DNA-binding transcriptional ArsR family regulator
MTIEAMSWAFKLQMGDSTEKFVLLALADHADEHGRCWPSLKRLSLFTSCAESTVRRALRRLEAQGLLTSEERRGTSRTYRINLGWRCQNDTPYQNDTPTTSDTPTPTTSDTPPLSRVTPEPSLNPQTTTIARKRSRASELPQDWKPTQAQIDYCRKQGCPSPQRDGDRLPRAFLGTRQADGRLGHDLADVVPSGSGNSKATRRPERRSQGGFNL